MSSQKITQQPAHEIIQLPGCNDPKRAELLQQCFDVRIKVFVHEQGFPLEVEIDEKEDVAIHFLLRTRPSLSPIGTIRALRCSDVGCYKISRLSVLRECRGCNFGRDLMTRVHSWIESDASLQALDHVDVVLHSQIYMIGFYQKLGYTKEGPEFYEDDAPHQRMHARFNVEAHDTKLHNSAHE